MPRAFDVSNIAKIVESFLKPPKRYIEESQLILHYYYFFDENEDSLLVLADSIYPGCLPDSRSGQSRTQW